MFGKTAGSGLLDRLYLRRRRIATKDHDRDDWQYRH